MNADAPAGQKPPPTRQSKRWRIAGVVFLLLGGLSAPVAYWHASKMAALMEDPSMLGFHRTEHRQMGMFFGKSGYVLDDLMNDLQQPGTQALVIIATAVVLAAGCFFMARLPAHDPKHDIFQPSKPDKLGAHDGLGH